MASISSIDSSDCNKSTAFTVPVVYESNLIMRLGSLPIGIFPFFGNPFDKVLEIQAIDYHPKRVLHPKRGEQHWRKCSLNT